MKWYFPTNEVSYYDDYNVYTTISWVDKEKGIVKVEDSISFYLISESKDKFCLPYEIVASRSSR